MLGNLIQEIMLSGDQEDLIEELCLIIYLSEEASHDDLYVKIAGDRIDNLLDIEFLEKAVGQYNGKNTDTIEKYFKSSYKALATSRAYLFLVRSRLQDPTLYGVIAYMMRWSEDKLSTLRAQFESRIHQSKSTPIVIPPVS
jgi:phytoene dehydrogenase-like protein